MKILNFTVIFILLNLFLSQTSLLQAEKQTKKSQKKENSELSNIEEKKLESISVIGAGRDIDLIPGSAFLLQGKELEKAKGGFDDINRTLRKVPGVNITEEDGFGLRPNIGLRGAAGQRSENITLMEDGVLIAPAPYSAPAAYYFPTMGRMSGIEVLKGASQVKYGPRTTGGSLNLLSTAIPQKFKTTGNVRVGEYDSLIGRLSIGESFKYGGYLLETYQAQSDGFKQLDNGGDTGFNLQDYNGKFRINTDQNNPQYHELELKLGTYAQEANETYLGLSREDFKKNPYRRYNASQLDNLNVDHDQINLKHYSQLSNKLDVTNILYLNKTKRNWYKLDSVNSNSIANILNDTNKYSQEYPWIKGENSTDSALTLRNNRRSYASRGFQSILGYDFETGSVKHEAETSVRFNSDYEDRFQDDDKYTMLSNKMILAEDGLPGSQTNRKSSADAWSFYAQDKISIDKLTITPGVRYEKINYLRRDWSKTDLSRDLDPASKTYSSIDKIIPGIGAHYQITDEVGAFAGAHLGFAPPGPQTNNTTQEEESVNYETGINYKKEAFSSELSLFANNYSNLLGADTLSAGGTGSGDLFNAGKARVWGSEVALRYDLNGNSPYNKIKLPVYINYTYTNSEFLSDFQNELFGTVLSGDRIPYIAPHSFSSGIALDHTAYRIALDMFYQGAMNTAAGQSNLRSNEMTDSYTVFDFELDYKLKGDESQIFLMVQNLFDQDYITSLKPAGARPGMPQTFMVGMKFELN